MRLGPFEETEWREWQDALASISDVAKVSLVGLVYYRKFYGASSSEDEGSAARVIDALAELLHRAFLGMDAATLRDLRENLIWQGRFFEPGLWENPGPIAEAHTVVENCLTAGAQPTLLELLLLAHDLEYFVRPNLLRLLWIAKRCDPTVTDPYPRAQLNEGGLQGSLGYATAGLLEWLRSPQAHVVEKQAREILLQFVEGMAGDDEDLIRLDDVRNWVAHRDFLIRKSEVVLNFHPAPGRRLQIPRGQVTEMRRQLLGLMCLMKAFETMFRLHEAAGRFE